MKKILLFLVLFGIGLGVLFWLEFSSTPEPSPKNDSFIETQAESALDHEAEALPDLSQAEPVVGVPDRDQANQGLAFNGPFQGRVYHKKTGLLKLEIESKDSVTLGDKQRLLEVKIKLFDAFESESKLEKNLLGVVDAKLAEIKPIANEGQESFQTEFEKQIQLDTLAAQMVAGQDLTDLHLSAPAGILDHRDPLQTLFRIEAALSIRSKELRAQGDGALITILNPKSAGGEQAKETLQFIEIDRNAELEFLHSPRTNQVPPQQPTLVKVTSEGSLNLNRMDRPESKSRSFEVWRSAHMTLSGGQESDLRAQHLLGRMRSNETGERMTLEGLSADGDVVWNYLTHTFQGSNLELSADERGELSSASITGFPSILLNLKFGPSKLNTLVKPKQGARKDQLKQPIERSQISLRSDSRIQMDRSGDRVKLRVVGPATAEAENFLLRSVGDLVMSFPISSKLEGVASGRVEIQASGGVVLELLEFEKQPYAKLESAALDLKLQHLDDSSPLEISIKTQGGAKLEGLLADGRPFVVDTPSSLSMEHRQGELELKEAHDVSVDIAALLGASRESEAGRAYVAKCKRLVQFNTSTEKLHARDGFSLTNQLGTFTGTRIETQGSHFVEVWGSQAEQVRLLSSFGRSDADYVKFTDGFYFMRGNVTASMVGSPKLQAEILDLKLERLDVICEELEVQVLEERLENVTRFKASNNVSCELIGAGRSFEMHHADELNLVRHEQFESEDKQGIASSSRLHVDASGSVHAHLGLAQSRFQIWSQRTDLDWDAQAGEKPRQDITARGNVRFDGRWRRGDPQGNNPLTQVEQSLGDVDAVNLEGHGELLEILATGLARLSAAPEQRVQLRGELPLRQPRPTRFELTASDVEFGPGLLDARMPEIQILPGTYRLIAERLVADPKNMDIRGRTTVLGETISGTPWSLSADHVELSDPTQANNTNTRSAPKLIGSGLLTVIEANGNVHFKLADRVEAFGDTLKRNALGISLFGEPCTIFTRRLGAPDIAVESKWIDFDPDLEVITEMGRGKISSSPSGNGGTLYQEQESEEWSLSFLSFKTEFDQDSVLFFIEEPFFEKHSEGLKHGLRSSYAVIWMPKERWKNITSLGELARSTAEQRATQVPTAEPSKPAGPAGSMDVFFHFLQSQGISDVVSEVYFEGPVQVFRDDVLISHADAVFLDLLTGQGWLTGVTLNINASFLGREDEEIVVRADWLRHSKDGSLTADRATITPCSFDEPHLRVVTGELKLTPNEPPLEPGYELSIKHNGVDVYGLFEIPLPPLEFNTDKELKPQFPSFRFGNSTRFGQLLSIKFTQPAQRLGRFFHKLFGDDSSEVDSPEPNAPAAVREPKEKKPYKAKYDIDASYLSSRGGLLDLGFSIRESKDRYWMEWINGVVLDNGRDRGYLSVPKRDRGSFRLWLRAQGQVQLDKNTIGFTLSDQSDPGVQSEFFESEFTRYERDETYLQWKRREGNQWLQAVAQVRVDENRAGVEELPAITAFQGRAQIYELGSTQLIHSGEFNAGYLRRLTPGRYDLDDDGIGESILVSPFSDDGSYADGLGAQAILRANTTQVLEAPYKLGVAGLRLTPFASLHGTYWDNAIDEDHAARVVGEMGVRLSTVMWRRDSDGAVDQFSPFLEYRNDVVREQTGRPLEIGSIERALFGNFIQVGSRSRFDVKDDRSRFDFDVKGIFASERSDGGADGWLPIEVFSRLGINPEGRRLDVWYDGRFDVENGEAVYSQFSLGTRIHDDFGVQVGYQYGRDRSLTKLFDTASVSGFYRWTDKWEFEARQSFSLLEDQQIGFEMILRRYGHDLIFELESKLREGEGSSLDFSVRPRLGFKPNRIGYTRW